MPYCTSCGAEVQAEASFCQACGRAQGGAVAAVGGYRISPTRIVVMSILSLSLYLFYWLYITWKQYRDHTGQRVYPVWHALTQFVPIYALFRVHAHARSFKELMTSANVQTNISPGGAVVSVLVYGVVNYIGIRPSFGEITEDVALAFTLIDILSVTIIAWVLLHLQGNINRYWDSMAGSEVANARIGVGEVIFTVMGVFLWLNTFATLLSPAYRTG